MTTPVLVPYQSSWNNDYRIIEAKLLEVLRQEAGIRIDHIGSTAVDGIAAKDIIDVQLGVASLAVIEHYRPHLEYLGLQYVAGILQDHAPFQDVDVLEPGYEKRFFNGTVGAKRVNLHVRVKGSPNWTFALLFKAFLQQHHEARTAYAQVKTRLSESAVTAYAYTYIKDPVCDLIYLLAKQWAADHRWQP